MRETEGDEIWQLNFMGVRLFWWLISRKKNCQQTESEHKGSRKSVSIVLDPLP